MTSKTEKREIVELLRDIDPYEFEAFVAELWNAEGFETTVTDSSSDLGVDVYAEQTGTINQTVAIQAKRYAEDKKVGRPDVQQYASLRTQDRDVDSVAIVTTSGFTDGAKAWAYENNLNLVNGEDITDMVLKHGRLDLLERYTGANFDSESVERVAQETEVESSSERVPNRRKTAVVGHLYAVIATMVLLVVGLVLTFVVETPNSGPIVWMIGWMGGAIAIFTDIRSLRRHDSHFETSYLYAAGTFALFGLPGLWYLLQRLMGTNLSEVFG